MALLSASGISGRVALVTGAAGGIGAAVASRLAEEGARVAVTDRAGDEAIAVAARLTEEGATAQGYALDVGAPAEVDALVERVEGELGPIDILVNVAGIFVPSPILEMEIEEWDRVFAVNARGVFACARAVARRMVPRGRGVIVTVASQSAKIIRVDQGAYGASKAAASYVTKCLGLELAKHGIRCNVVHPGVTETPLARAQWASGVSSPSVHLDGRLERFRVGVPLKKIGQPADVANAVAFLVSDHASHITMTDLMVDGGQTLFP